MLAALALCSCGGNSPEQKEPEKPLITEAEGGLPRGKDGAEPTVAQVALSAIDRSRLMGSREDLRGVAAALRMRAQDDGRYPEVEEYQELSEYLIPNYMAQLPPKDFWGNEYRYDYLGGRPELRSAGRDGAFDTEDDIVVRP